MPVEKMADTEGVTSRVFVLVDSTARHATKPPRKVVSTAKEMTTVMFSLLLEEVR